MKCSYCGVSISPEQKFCLNCGTELKPEIQEEGTVWAEQLWEEIPTAVEILTEPEEPASGPETVETAPAAVAPAPAVRKAPLLQLPVKRGLGKMVFLGILTLGIYPAVIWSRIVTELNLAASRYDGKRTMPYFGMILLGPITLGIFPLVWIHKFCNRVGDELYRRGSDYKFNAATFWLWNVLGALILAGPFIFVHKLMKSMNLINGDFNKRG